MPRVLKLYSDMLTFHTGILLLGASLMMSSFFKQRPDPRLPKEKTFDLTSMHLEHLSEDSYETFQWHIEAIVAHYENDKASRLKESSIFFDWQKPHVALHIELDKTLSHCRQNADKGEKLGSVLLFYWQQKKASLAIKCQLEKTFSLCYEWLGDDETYALRDLVFKQFLEFEKACIPDNLDELYDDEALTKYQNIGVPQLNEFVETFYSHLLTFKKVCDGTDSRPSDGQLAISLNTLFSAVEQLEPIAVNEVVGHLAYV